MRSVDILVKAVLGGLLVAGLLSLAKRGHYFITGMLVSLPAISLYTWWWLGREEGPEALRSAVQAAIWGAIPWVMYLSVVYLLAGRLPLWLTLLCGVSTYLAVASAFTLVLAPRV